jgi:hypothetical protein
MDALIGGRGFVFHVATALPSLVLREALVRSARRFLSLHFLFKDLTQYQE